MVPVEQAPFISIIRRQQVILVPADPALVLSIVDGKDGGDGGQVGKGIRMFDEKRDQAGLVIVYMDDVRMVLPLADPVANGDLESHEAAVVVVVAVDLLAVKESVDVDEIKVKPEFVGLFMDDRVVEVVIAHLLVAFMDQLKLVLVKEFGAIHGHHYFSYMTQFALVLGQ